MDYDFIGFTYNEKHSIRDLKIYRTSEGSRYNTNINPILKDTVVSIPGVRGQLILDSYHQKKNFDINFAFDSLTRDDINKLKECFDGKEVHEFIFDEYPYKAYLARVSNGPTINYIPFEEEGVTVYKGEGKISFICYQPYAQTPSKLWSVIETTNNDGKRVKNWNYIEADGRRLSSYSEEAYSNKQEWAVASGLGENIYINVGDIPMPLIITFNGESVSLLGQTLIVKEGQTGSMEWNTATGLVKNSDGKAVLTEGSSIIKIPPGSSFSVANGTIKEFKYLYY